MSIKRKSNESFHLFPKNVKLFGNFPEFCCYSMQAEVTEYRSLFKSNKNNTIELNVSKDNNLFDSKFCDIKI